jgi:hypothetical protein
VTDQGCLRYRGLAAEYAVTDLDGRERVQLIDHLQHCQGCRRVLRDYTEVADALVVGLPAIEPPAGFDDRVLAGLERHRRDDDLDADTLWMVDAVPPPRGPHPSDGLTVVVNSADREDTSHGDEVAGRRRSGIGGRRTALRWRLPDPDGTLPPPPGGARRHRPVPHWHRYIGRTALIAIVVVLGVVGGTIGFVDVSPPAVSSAPLPGSTTPPAVGSVLHAPLTRGPEAVGQIYAHPGQLPGDPTWIYVVLDHDRDSTPPGAVVLSVQLLDAQGTTRGVATLTVTDGYGAWAGPVSEDPYDLTRAQLTDPTGTPYATADLADY